MGVDRTLSARNHRLSILKYLRETIGDEGEGRYAIVTDTMQVDFNALRASRAGWVTVEFGPSTLSNRMTQVLFVSCCARDNDSDLQMDSMRDAVRDSLAPGSIFPMYNIDTQAVIGGFVVRDCIENREIEQPGGGLNATFIVTLMTGVVI